MRSPAVHACTHALIYGDLCTQRALAKKDVDLSVVSAARGIKGARSRIRATRKLLSQSLW